MPAFAANAACSAAPGPAARGSTKSLFDRRAILCLLIAAGAYMSLDLAEVPAVVMHLKLPDTDDAMRLVGVRDLVNGQPWFDNTQHRFLPPDGVASHWSRLVDAPIAAGVLALTPLLGARLAEGLTAALWPPLLFAGYAAILFAGMVRPFGRRAALLAVFAATQVAVLAGHFTVGRVDHHNVQACTVLTIGLCLARRERTWRTGAVAGALAAFSLAVGLESLPFIVVAGLVTIADWIVFGRSATRFLVGFAVALGLAAPALFAVQTAPALWSAAQCDALSLPWLWLTSAAACGALVIAASTSRLHGPAARLVLALAFGAAALVGFAAIFPTCLGGPFPGMPDAVREHWLRNVGEMEPIFALISKQPVAALGLGAPVLIAAVAASAAAWSGWLGQRRWFLVAAAFMATGAVLAVFEVRGLYLAAGFVPLVAGPVLDRAVALLAAPGSGVASRVGMLALAFSLDSRVWLLGERFVPEVQSPQAAAVAVYAACTDRASLAPLDRLDPGTVLSAIDSGPNVLLQTHHAVVAAPYHRAVPGLLAGIAAQSGTEDEVRRSVERLGVDYLVLCPKQLQEGSDGATPFATRLSRAEITVPWLERLPMPGTPIQVWRVRKTAGQGP
jgi:hypothetical protein